MSKSDSGLDLAGRFFHDAVGPIISRTIADLRYGAALIGPGSEVLGYDTTISRDHDWSPRVQIFVAGPAEPEVGTALRVALDRELPEVFAGFPVRIDRSDPGVGKALNHPELGHRVVVDTVAGWMSHHFEWHDASSPTVDDWLATPQQRLLEFTAGRVFRDDLGELTVARQRLRWYPDDLWRYLIACQWQRVAQLEPFVGRAGDVGDDLGSRLVAASLGRDAIRLAFLIERQYAPYTKWLGTSFQRLPVAGKISDGMDVALAADDWGERESALVAVFEILGHATNRLGLADSVDPSARPFYDRPYRVVDAHRLREALNQRIEDPDVRGVIERIGWVGAVDQFSDSVDLLGSPNRFGLVAP